MVNEVQQKDCLCRGSNRDCMHCYGSGIIEIKIKSQVTKNNINNALKEKKEFRDGVGTLGFGKARCARCSVVLSKEQTPCLIDKNQYCKNCYEKGGKPINIEECPYCGQLMTKSVFARHIEIMHSVKCPHCTTYFLREDNTIEQHIKEQHQENIKIEIVDKKRELTDKNILGHNSVNKAKTGIEPKHNNYFVRCEYCDCNVKKSNLDKHKKKIHKNLSSENKQIKGNPLPKTSSSFKQANQSSGKGNNYNPISKFHNTSSTISTSIDNSININDLRIVRLDTNTCSNSYTEQKIEKKLDYTTSYYTYYKEDGRFGSHPSHDDYGEESEP